MFFGSNGLPRHLIGPIICLCSFPCPLLISESVPCSHHGMSLSNQSSSSHNDLVFRYNKYGAIYNARKLLWRSSYSSAMSSETKRSQHGIEIIVRYVYNGWIDHQITFTESMATHDFIP